MREFLNFQKILNKQRQTNKTPNHQNTYFSPFLLKIKKRDILARKLPYSTTQTLSSPHIKENLL